jgi:hypothetical protein
LTTSFIYSPIYNLGFPTSWNLLHPSFVELHCWSIGLWDKHDCSLRVAPWFSLKERLSWFWSALYVKNHQQDKSLKYRPLLFLSRDDMHSILFSFLLFKNKSFHCSSEDTNVKQRRYQHKKTYKKRK